MNDVELLGERRISALLRRCGRGEPEGAADLFDLTWAAMLSVARCVTRDEHLAHEAVARAYLTVWAKAMRGDDFGSTPSLRLLAIAHAAASAEMSRDLIA